MRSRIAIEGYHKAIAQLSCSSSSKAPTELSKCLCNRALSFLKLKKWDLAITDSESVLEQEPVNAKAHFRLACALFKDGHLDSQEAVSKVAFHVSVAMSLLALTAKIEPSMSELLDAVRSKSAKPTATASEILAVRTSSELQSALSRDGIKFIVLCPGQYTGSFLLCRDMTMVGLGQVTFLKGYDHTILVEHGRVDLRNVRVTDGPKYRPGRGAFCISGPTSCLFLADCIVEDSCEVGLIAGLEGRCFIDSCHFRRLGRQAIEVREMGQVEVRRSNFQQVWQGVCAYAGARSVVMEDVLVDGAFNEGVLASGDFKNLETQELERLEPGKGKASSRRKDWKDGAEASKLAHSRAKRLGWNGRLTLTMSKCTIRNARGLACSIDEGCAAVLTCCSLENTLKGTSNPWPGIGMLIKGGSDVTIRSCRVLKNKVGVQVGFNYGGNVVVEESIFSGNLLKDLLEETLETDTDTKKLKGFLPQTMLEKVKAERMLHEKAGAWSSATPITKIRNRFLSRSERIPEIEELKSASMAAPQQPLPQKLAWEAAARGRYSLATPCPCGFSCTELGNSAECGQAGLGNHVDYPPLMCLPCSESLEAKQDDANGQFYFLDGRVPFRHWCLVGEIKAVDVARGADAHSFMAARGSDAAKTIKLQTKFAGPGEVDVEVLLMLEDALPRGSAAIASGNTLAILYAEAHDIDITRGTGQVVVADNSSIYAFAASLDQVVGQSAQFASSDGNARCGHCGNLQQTLVIFG